MSTTTQQASTVEVLHTLLKAARGVLESWDSGDLANAVTQLGVSVEEADSHLDALGGMEWHFPYDTPIAAVLASATANGLRKEALERLAFVMSTRSDKDGVVDEILTDFYESFDIKVKQRSLDGLWGWAREVTPTAATN
ncbi:hypothetical protein N5B55_04955 [Ralstonia pickettii]|uniref:hypothetical protein n=1 Tax=Ralstonia pickettii TaxID=329 RepID=UPI0027147636|nr:hypothetical protein [Ralstonia pickettii]WKZ86303.1 hypothetical protein N5B55_04955 [Ralstonia pickettii]